jgi:hypothetical protein
MEFSFPSLVQWLKLDSSSGTLPDWTEIQDVLRTLKATRMEQVDAVALLPPVPMESTMQILTAARRRLGLSHRRR